MACEIKDPSARQKIMQMLLDCKGTNPNIKNKTGWTPLHLCVKKKLFEEVRLLLEYGADPNITDSAGWSALCIAFNEVDDTAGKKAQAF